MICWVVDVSLVRSVEGKLLLLDVVVWDEMVSIIYILSIVNPRSEE